MSCPRDCPNEASKANHDSKEERKVTRAALGGEGSFALVGELGYMCHYNAPGSHFISRKTGRLGALDFDDLLFFFLVVSLWQASSALTAPTFFNFRFNFIQHNLIAGNRPRFIHKELEMCGLSARDRRRRVIQWMQSPVKVNRSPAWIISKSVTSIASRSRVFRIPAHFTSLKRSLWAVRAMLPASERNMP